MESSLNALIFEVDGHVRTAAEIDEMRPERVFGEDVAGAFLDQLAFFIQSSAYFRRPSSLRVSMRS